MKILLKARMKDHVMPFWNRTQDEEIKRLFPFSTESLEEALVLFEESLKENALSYGKVGFVKIDTFVENGIESKYFEIIR